MAFSLPLLLILLVGATNHFLSGELVEQGPCTTLGIRVSDHFPAGTHLKCTDNGYFEVVQCVTDFCVCVDPTTGYPTIATKTSTGKTVPVCGNCHVQLAEFLKRVKRGSKGVVAKADQIEPNDVEWKPICEYKHGNFVSKQCLDVEKCFCVDAVTGKRQTQGYKSNALLDCGVAQKPAPPQVAFVLEPKPVNIVKKPLPSEGGSKALPPLLPPLEFPLGDPICSLPKARGIRCSSVNPVVKWYFDADTQECLAYLFNGCQGNENQFDSPSECWSKCKLPDFGGCAGQAAPARHATEGHTIICGNKDETTDPCPTGYRCTMMAFHGLCCPTETQDLYLRNYKPGVCAGTGGASPLRLESAGVPMVLIGKKCADEFCPKGATCRQQEIFAHCCPPPPPATAIHSAAAAKGEK